MKQLLTTQKLLPFQKALHFQKFKEKNIKHFERFKPSKAVGINNLSGKFLKGANISAKPIL